MSDIQRHIGVHMSDEEFKQCDYADEVGFESPVPTQIVSNGEYNPLPQTEHQKKVEGLIKRWVTIIQKNMEWIGENF